MFEKPQKSLINAIFTIECFKILLPLAIIVKWDFFSDFEPLCLEMPTANSWLLKKQRLKSSKALLSFISRHSCLSIAISIGFYWPNPNTLRESRFA